MLRLIRPTVLLLIAACGGSEGPSLEPILIEGSDMGPRFQNFTVFRGRTPLTDAQVFINDVQLPPSSNGGYNFDRGSFLAPGETLVVRVVHAGETVEGRATIIGGATMVAPVADQSITLGQPINFSWTATTAPDYWRVSLTYRFNNAGQGQSDSLGPAARSHALSTATVPVAGTGFIGYIFGYQRGTFTGPVDSRSTMRVRTIALQAALTKS